MKLSESEERAEHVAHFCRFPLSEMVIAGLHIQIEEQSERTQKAVFYDKKGAKWEIRTITYDNEGNPTRLSLSSEQDWTNALPGTFGEGRV